MPSTLKALASEDTLLRTHCCSWCFLGTQTRGTQNECCVSMLRKPGNICCRHKMFLNKIRNSFCVLETKFVFATKCCARGQMGKHLCRQQSVATMCPRLPGPLLKLFKIVIFKFKVSQENIVNNSLWIQPLLCFKANLLLTSHQFYLDPKRQFSRQ